MDVLVRNLTDCDYDSSCRILQGQFKLAVKLQNSASNAAIESIITRGFDSGQMKVCSDQTRPDGSTQETCVFTKPPALAADTTSFQLGELPALQLLNSDELNELLSGLMSQLTNLVLNSVTGVLGLSGNPDFGGDTFGESGDQTFIDLFLEDSPQLPEDTPGGGGAAATNPIAAALAAEIRYVELLDLIINEVESLEATLAADEAEFGSCFSLELPDELDASRNDAEQQLTGATAALATLTALAEAFAAAGDAIGQNNVLTDFWKRYQTLVTKSTTSPSRSTT